MHGHLIRFPVAQSASSTYLTTINLDYYPGKYIPRSTGGTIIARVSLSIAVR